MIKRLISFFAVVIITVVLLIPIVNAEEFIVNPEYDRQPLYEILPSDVLSDGAEPYIVYGIDVSSITVMPDPVGFITHFFGSSRAVGEYYVYMYSARSTVERSRLRLFISNNMTMVLWYEVGDFLSGSSSDYYQYQITPSISIDDDFMIYSAVNGTLYQYYYDTTNDIPTISQEALKFCFIGDIYIYGRTPSDVDNVIIQDAFDRGKAEGFEEGLDTGYSEGYKDGQLATYDEQIVYNTGYQNGYNVGKAEGLEEGALLDNEAVFNAGVAKGQEQAEIIPSAINGFFGAMQGFFQPFLSIGVGSLNLLNMLGIMIVVVVVMVIVKVTRG